MKLDVRENWVAFCGPLEGVVRWHYLDVLGLVTTAMGNLVDPVESALDLPMVHKGTSIPATREEIRREWQRVKDDPIAAKLGHRSLEASTTLRLTDAGVDLIVSKRLLLNDKLLRQRFPDFEEWPADAQLATHSMAWACGPYFRFPKLEAALKARDFKTAAVECYMNTTGNPGLRPRNYANKALYMAAASLERDDERITWAYLTLIDAKLWPRRELGPANDVEEPFGGVGGIVHAPLDWGSPTDRDPDEPPSAA